LTSSTAWYWPASPWLNHVFIESYNVAINELYNLVMASFAWLNHVIIGQPGNCQLLRWLNQELYYVAIDELYSLETASFGIC
jgi:hypothetical protein